MSAPNDWLEERFESLGEREFLVTEQGRSGYRELLARIRELRQYFLTEQLPRGSVVALLGDYSLNGIAGLLALTSHACVAAPITALPEEETKVRLQEGRIGHILDFDDTGKPRLRKISGQPADPHPLINQLRTSGQGGLILFSSGSSGKPKAMVHDWQRLSSPFKERKLRNLTFLIFLLFDHIGGLNTLLNALSSGGKIVYPPKRDPMEVARLIEKEKVSLLPTSPTFLNLLLMSGAAERYDLSSLKIISYGTEPMPESLLLRLKNTFPKTRFLQTFGTSETGITQTTSLSSGSNFMKLDDPNLEYRIVNGELWMRSATRILGYLNHSMEAFTEDGWFKTGDLVEETGDGYLRIRGRVSELINVGGEKVLPGEVESVLLEIPSIRDCLVYGEPNALTGQSVAVRVVAAPGTDMQSIKREIRTHCRTRLDPYKIPVRVKLVDSTDHTERFKKARSKGS